MPTLLIVGGGLFGSQAAAYARRKGIEAIVFDAALAGAASPAAAGLLSERWVSRKLRPHFDQALPVLEALFGLDSVSLAWEDGQHETFLFVPPTRVLEPNPLRHTVTAVGDGWLEADGRRYDGWVYVAAGVWSDRFCPGLPIRGKAGAAFLFAGERPGQIRSIGPGRQALAFVRDPGITYFSDGTAEEAYTPDHERQSLERAAGLELSSPVKKLCGIRPYIQGGPRFQQLGRRTWLASGGRKMGTLLGAAFARRLVEEELPGTRDR